MVARRPVFGGQAFTVSQGLRAGIGRGELAGAGFAHPFHGVRQSLTTSSEELSDRERMLRLCRQYAPRLRPGQFYSHDTVLVALGVPSPRSWAPTLHVATYRPSMCPRTVGVVGHRLRARPRAAWRIGDLPIEHPARAWVQSADLWSDDDLIAAGDFLVSVRHPLITTQDLRAEIIESRRTRLLRVVDEIRTGSESKRETELRLAVVRAGLPEPLLNWELRAPTGRLVARLDEAWPDLKVAVEYDGRQHASDPHQFRRDADRWDDIRNLGWHLVWILDHHMRDGAGTAVDKVRVALTAAGWRPFD